MRRSYASLLPALALLAVSACTAGRSEIADCPVQRTPVERFSLCLTDNWKERVEPYGEEGSIVVFIQPQESTGSLMQIHVKKDPLEEAVSSPLDFAQRAVEITRSEAPNYVPVRIEPMTINGKKTLLHVFDAKPSSQDDPVRYYQFVTTNAQIAYGFTAIMRPSVDDDTREQLIGILKSVSFE